MRSLYEYFASNEGRIIHKWDHYFEVYERYFSRFRGLNVNVLEFGVGQGGSLEMWREYFGEDAQIYGVDVSPECRQVQGSRIQVEIGDQGDRGFLRRLMASLPPIDVVIDDGGHRMEQQIATFEEVYPRMTDHGVYLCEDTQTSYWSRHGGGYRRAGTFMEYAKDRLDDLHAWHSKDPESFRPSEVTATTLGVHFFGGMIVFERRPMTPPTHRRTGGISLNVDADIDV